MTKKELKNQLMNDYPLIKCGNSLEFKQRLQWLSEGMLKNHLLSIIDYSIDQNEIELYKNYKNNLTSSK